MLVYAARILFAKMGYKKRNQHRIHQYINQAGTAAITMHDNLSGISSARRIDVVERTLGSSNNSLA